MLVNRDHRWWALATVAVAVAAAMFYAGYAVRTRYGASGGSPEGLFFGITGTAMMLVAGVLPARRKLLLWRLGSALLWMKMHVWLGLLAIPFILFHSAFAWGGPLTTALMVLFYIVVASGIFGLVLQQFVPAAMTRQVPLETIHSQIDHVMHGLAVDAYELVASITGPIGEVSDEPARLTAEEEIQRTRPKYWKQTARQRPAENPPPEAAALRSFYLTEIRTYLRRSKGGSIRRPDFGRIAVDALPEWRAKLDRLQEMCEESHQLSVQKRLHALLHGWLYVHAPLSFALFVLTAFHIYFALSY